MNSKLSKYHVGDPVICTLPGGTYNGLHGIITNQATNRLGERYLTVDFDNSHWAVLKEEHVTPDLDTDHA